jgi:hypothetical protein
MTSFAFILGVVPLLAGNGAGAEMRQTLGTAVFSGMLGVTLFGIFLTPVFFYVIEGFAETPLFSSERARLVGKVLRFTLGAITLGLLWLPGVLGRLLRRRSRVPVIAREGPATVANGTVAAGRHLNAPHGAGLLPDGLKVVSNGEAATPDARPILGGQLNNGNGEPAAVDNSTDQGQRK